MDWNQIDDSPKQIRELLAGRGIALKKRWGQNFMISRPVRQRIVDLLVADTGVSVWEVGPGLGALTTMLVDSGADVTVFEVDWGMVRVVTDRFGDRVAVVQGDAAATLGDRARALPQRLAGNLPYRSAAAIITTLLERPDAERVECIVITVQREMARRIVAVPGSRDYSPFSVLCALTTEATLHGDIPHTSFYPQPGVVSTLVRLMPRPVDHEEIAAASMVARALFGSRRKTIANNLAPIVSGLGLTAETILDRWRSLGIDGTMRAETIEPHTFLEMARVIRD
jgi:16S rRNA (adenine1518-N6/adenine1519-N6)-dimethyltransferase